MSPKDDLNYRKLIRKELIKGTNDTECICETLRQIYDLIYDWPDERKEAITEKLVDATIYAKKMFARLTYYKTTYNDNTGHNGRNRKRILGSYKIYKMRKARNA